MKKLMRLICFAAALVLLAGCGADTSTGDAGTAAPTTTAAPTETASKYPEPDKLIALTFDDGPNAHMGTIIQVLADYDAKATFFVIGKKIDGTNAEYVKTAFDAGHEIGNHSYNHVDITALTESEIYSEISLTQQAVASVTGTEPVWYRPPFGKTSELTFSLIEMPNALWGVSAGDGTNDNLADDRYYRVTSGAYDGAIVLLHCNDITAEVLPRILEELKMQGYEFVTISELFARTGQDPTQLPSITYKDNKPQE